MDLLTPEEKKIVAEWMTNWKWNPITCVAYEPTYGIDYYSAIKHNFDPNDAAIVVAEMVKRGEYFFFMDAARESWLAEENISDYGLFAWLYTTESGEATNFFRSMAEWVKERKGK